MKFSNFLNLKNKRAKRGSALLLTMFIMAGMLIVAMSGAYIVLLGIKAGGIQSQSTKAYFAAEAGAERLLWEMRQNGCQSADPSCTAATSSEAVIFTGSLVSGATYEIYFTAYPPFTFQSVGDDSNTRRSVEVRM